MSTLAEAWAFEKVSLFRRVLFHVCRTFYSFVSLKLKNTAMAKLEDDTTLQRLRNRYRLVILNDDTYEEVVTFRLSRMSVYIALSTMFVLLTSLTVGLIVFTPLRYYVPGYGNANLGREYRQLKYVTDSLEKQVTYQAEYINGIKKVLAGDIPVNRDTTQIQIPNDEYSND
jgi:hypothetical protein